MVLPLFVLPPLAMFHIFTQAESRRHLPQGSASALPTTPVTTDQKSEFLNTGRPKKEKA